MDRRPHQIQHDASPQSLHQSTQLNAEVALESNNNKLVLKRDSIDFASYQNHTPIKATTPQQTKAPTPITAQAVETSPSLDDLDYYEPAPAIQLALASGVGSGANTTPTTPNAITYCSQQHHVNTATSQPDYYSSPEAVESPLAAGSLSNGCSGGGGTQTRASWPSSALRTAAHQMASAAAAAVAVAGSQSPQLMAQSGQTNHLAALTQSGQQHNQFQNQVNSQYASLHHHSQVQAHHQHSQQQVSPAGRSISPYQASYGTSPALANGYAPGHHHHHHSHQHHQHQLHQQHHQPPHQSHPLPPPPPQPMSLEAHQYGDAAQAMATRLPQTKHTHNHHNVQHHLPNNQHTSQHHHNLPQHHHHQIQEHPYTNMPPAHSNHQLNQNNQHNHEQHYGNNHQPIHYMNHLHHNHPHQAAHLSSPPGVAIGPPDQSHEPIYPVQHMQQQHSIQHLAPGGYYQPKGHNHHHHNQNQPQQQHHHHQNHYQQYPNSQQLFRSSTMLTPPRVEPILLRPSQMATPPQLDSGNNPIRANLITTSPQSDNNNDRSSSKKAESPLNQLHLQCANLLDEHQQQQQRISNILLKDGIDLSASNDNNISTTATTTTPANVAGASVALAATATTSAKTSTTSTTSATSNGDSNLNNDNNISTTATATTTTTGNSNNSASNNNGSNNNGGRSKRLRTSFKHNQLKEMKRYFATNQNPDANNLKTLAQTTGLSKRVLQVWFQNARAKHRRNTARLANQQLFNVVNQHTMLPRHHHQQGHLQAYQHHDTQHHQPIN